jgi:GntR family transcriptional repressor for pyruvate dehydrogenase complex
MATVAQDESKSLVAQAMDAVKAFIRENALRVGDALPGEGYFAEQLGVSRAVMREAFGGLAALKLIDVANGRRAKVGALDGSVIAASLDHALSTDQIKVADIWDVRRTIEMRTAALAALNATAVQAAKIVALAEAMGEDDQPHEQTTEDDIDFHLAIAEASGNALFNQIVMSFVPLMRVAVPQAWGTRRTADEKTDILARHKRLAWAIANRNADEAEQAMAAHFDEAIGALLR